MKLLLLPLIAGALLLTTDAASLGTAAIVGINAIMENCPMQKLTLDKRRDIHQAKELICRDLFGRMAKNAKQIHSANPRGSTQLQWEIQAECTKIFNEKYLKNTQGKSITTEEIKAALYKIEDIPCIEKDKIIDYSVGVLLEKYD